jgi:hypothetical protein
VNRASGRVPRDAAASEEHAPADGASIAAGLRQFLELGVAQLDATMRESDARVDLLTSIISSLATDACELHTLARRFDPSDGAELEHLHGRVQQLAEALNQHAQSAITALQFYDKLIQRLMHVRDGLAIPSDSAAGVAEAVRPSWTELLEQVRARYSTVDERVLFDFMMSGWSADQRLKALSGLRTSVATGEYEPF